jgi:hypothetical protein
MRRARVRLLEREKRKRIEAGVPTCFKCALAWDPHRSTAINYPISYELLQGSISCKRFKPGRHIPDGEVLRDETAISFRRIFEK